jgi:hypothetical protein
VAEELTRSLGALAERGSPRGAADVLFEARRDAVRRAAPRYQRRPGWAAAAAFVVTLVVVGGSLALGFALQDPGSDVGSGWVGDVVGDAAATTSVGWLLIPAIAVAGGIALIVRNKVKARKELAMATTVETAPAKELETTKRNNHWLIVAVVVLAVALVALGAWVMYDQSSEPETAASAELTSLYDDYVGAYVDGDEDAFLAVTTEEYTFHSFGTIRERAEQVPTVRTTGGLVIEPIGELVATGQGPDYYVAAAEHITLGGIDYYGVSAYRVIDTPEGLKIVEHSWVGNL